MAKRHKRIWTKRVKYDVRKNFADSRLRVKGRFVKKEDEELLRELLNMTQREKFFEIRKKKYKKKKKQKQKQKKET